MSPKANPVPKAIGKGEGCKINLICVMMIIAWRGNFVEALSAKKVVFIHYILRLAKSG